MKESLQFKNNRFRVMLVGDPHCRPDDEQKKDKDILKDYLELQYTAIKEASPDFVVLMGDNAYGNDLDDIRKTLFRITKPYADNDIPFSFVLGNHDLQVPFTELNGVYDIYSSLPCCILPADRTEYGDFMIPVFSEKSDVQKLNLIFIYSGSSENADKGTVYDYVLPEQLDWLEKEQKKLGDIPSVLFQHIPFPEEFKLLKETTPLSMIFQGVLGQNEQKGRFFKLKKGVSGYLGEAPCAPAINTGEFNVIKQCRNIFAAFFGHDHLNDFSGTADGIIMGQCKTASFNVYGDGLRQGVRILDFYEDSPYHLDTYMLRYKDLVSKKCRSLSGSIAVIHDKTSTKIKVCSGVLPVLAAASLPFIIYGTKQKKRN